MTLTRFRPHSSGVFLALILFLSGCEKVGDQIASQMKELPEKSPAFPITRTLIDSTGRPLEATLIGRGVNSITVIRKSDSNRFDIPLARLSAEDQAFIAKLPLTSTPLAESGPVTRSAGTNSNGALTFLLAKREELEKKIEDNTNLLSTAGAKTVKGRTIRSERERLLSELNEVVAEIQEIEAK